MALRFGRTEEWEPSHPGQLSRIAQRSRLGSCSRAPQAGYRRATAAVSRRECWWCRRRKDRPLCGAKTRAGGTCMVRVEFGKARCRFHGGLSTGPKTEAGRARIAEARRRRWCDYRERRQGMSLAVTPVGGDFAPEDGTTDLRITRSSHLGKERRSTFLSKGPNHLGVATPRPNRSGTSQCAGSAAIYFRTRRPAAGHIRRWCYAHLHRRLAKRRDRSERLSQLIYCILTPALAGDRP
jgi:hypothetical protein